MRRACARVRVYVYMYPLKSIIFSRRLAATDDSTHLRFSDARDLHRISYKNPETRTNDAVCRNLRTTKCSYSREINMHMHTKRTRALTFGASESVGQITAWFTNIVHVNIARIKRHRERRTSEIPSVNVLEWHASRLDIRAFVAAPLFPEEAPTALSSSCALTVWQLSVNVRHVLIKLGAIEPTAHCAHALTHFVALYFTLYVHYTFIRARARIILN